MVDTRHAGVAGSEEEPEGPGGDLRVLRARWGVVAVGLVLGLLAGLLFGLSSSRGYESEADLLVSPAPADDVFAGLPLLRDPSGTVFTAAHLIEQPQVVDEVRKRVDGDFTRSELMAKVTVTPIEQSGLVSVVAKDSDPERAAEIANAFIAVLIEQRTAQFQQALTGNIDRVQKYLDEVTAARGDPTHIATITARLATLQSLVGADDPTLSLWSIAVPALTKQSFPMVAVLIGGLVGLVLGMGAALLWDRLDPRVKRGRGVLARLPVLASVPSIGKPDATTYLNDPQLIPSEIWEAFWELRLNLARLDADGADPPTILVASAQEHDGKTSVAIHLAITLANAGRRVVLVDGNRISPAVASAFRVEEPTGDGFHALFSEDGELERALAVIPDQGELLRLLLPGQDRDSTEGLPLPGALRTSLERLKKYADVVVIDSASVAQSIDALVWASAVDAVVVAVREGHSRTDAVAAFVRSIGLRAVPAGFALIERRRVRAGARAGRSASAQLDDEQLGVDSLVWTKNTV